MTHVHRLFIFDADGTLRRCTIPGQPCPNHPGEWEVILGVRERLSTIDWQVNHFAIASNQGGIALGFLSATDARGMLDELVKTLLGRSILADSVAICSHAAAAGCPCRKPEPGMLNRIRSAHGVEREETLFVGDQDSDRAAAERAGVDFAWAKDFFGWTTNPC
jgi:D-glycero-D-manno-heptose 1,7-bisphosphate phosphatase